MLPVALVAIDEIVPPDARVSVMRLDIEGSEESALAGGMATIRRCRPILIRESLPRQGSAVGQDLGTLGYRAERRLARNTVLIAQVDNAC